MSSLFQRVYMAVGLMWLLLGSLLYSSSALESLLKSFSGNWEGELTIVSIDGLESQIISVSQRYWWDMVGLRGEVVYAGDEHEFSASSFATVIDDKIFSEVVHAEKKEMLQGLAWEQGIIWARFGSGVEPTMQLHERLITEEGGLRVIEIKGHEIRPSEVQPRRYLIRGYLKEVKTQE
jgi:hypothetical protein